MTLHELELSDEMQLNDDELRLETVRFEETALFYIRKTLNWVASRLLAVAKADGFSKVLEVIVEVELT